MALLIDVGAVSCGCTDHALDELHKAISDPPGSDTVWEPHHDPYVRDHIEIVTGRISGRLELVFDALSDPRAFLSPLEKAISGPWAGVDEAAMEAIARDLAAMSPESYSPDDWLTLVDLVLHRYLPDEVIASEADYMAIRAVFSGRVKAHIAGLDPSPKIASLAVGITPKTYAEALESGAMSERVGAAVDFARTRAAELIVDLTENARRKIKRCIIEHEERKAFGETVTAWDLQSKLRDQHVELNRDWRRIALTEIGRDANEGFLATVPNGGRFRHPDLVPLS